jgi:hypothetical protein
MHRAKKAILEWAQVSDVRVNSLSRRWLSLGPFQWRGSRWNRMFYVTAEDASGRQMEGYARVGGGYAGLIADEVEVRWS